MPPKRKRAPNSTNSKAESETTTPHDGLAVDASGPDSEALSAQQKEQSTPAPRPKSARSVKTKTEEDDVDALDEDVDMGDDAAADGEDEDDVDVDAPVGGGEGGEAGTMSMAPPPKAGIVDPVGYHTNSPPEDRAVRVYADGVFDLFHLGYVCPTKRSLEDRRLSENEVLC